MKEKKILAALKKQIAQKDKEYGTERIELSDEVMETIRQRDTLHRLSQDEQLRLYKKAWAGYCGHWQEFDLYKEMWKAYQEEKEEGLL